MALVQSSYPTRDLSHRVESRHGLSTTELIVTMGILAVLVGISVTVLSGARRSRSQALCAANLHSIGIAFALYEQDYLNSYPIATPNAQWEDLLRPYTPRGTFHCPADAELFSALSSSYDWRDTGDPNTTLAGRLAIQVAHSDASLAFDALPEWHQKKSIQILRVNNSVELVNMSAFFQDMQRSPIDP